MYIGTLGHTYLYNTQSNKLLKRNEKFMVEIQVKQQQQNTMKNQWLRNSGVRIALSARYWKEVNTSSFIKRRGCQEENQQIIMR